MPLNTLRRNFALTPIEEGAMCYGKSFKDRKEVLGMTEPTSVAKSTTKLAKKNQPLPVSDEEVLDWNFTLDVVPPPRRSGTIEVVLRQVTISPPVVELD